MRRALRWLYGALFDHWGAKITALVVASVFFIVTRDDVTRRFTIPLRVTDDPRRVLLTRLPETVTVELHGSWTRMNPLSSQDLGSAQLDLAGARPGPLQLDLRRREAQANGRLLALTAAEMRVLEQLLRHPGEVLSRARLTQLALDRPIEAYDRSIDTLISKLRRKLEAAGLPEGCIGGVRGQGYVIDPGLAARGEA